MGREYIETPLKVETLRLLVESCSKQSVPALKEALIQYGWDTWNNTRTTIQEYLKRLQMGKYIHIDGNECWTYNRWQKILLAREKDYNKMTDIINR